MVVFAASASRGIRLCDTYTELQRLTNKCSLQPVCLADREDFVKLGRVRVRHDNTLVLRSDARLWQVLRETAVYIWLLDRRPAGSGFL